jgi:phosphoribosylamine---glycine ligase
MKFLVIGSGGREHALAWRLSTSDAVEEVFVVPGNPGCWLEPKVSPLPINNTPSELIQACKTKKIDTVIIGPEGPLAAGLADQLRAADIPCLGPNRSAARLESSKAFCKDFLRTHQIPTADYEIHSIAEQAHHAIEQRTQWPVVIKASGLASGKGVIIADSMQQAHTAIDTLMYDPLFAHASTHIIIEEYLEGEELSFTVLTDGHTLCPLAGARDYKRLLNDDQGPNTGGMGAYSPVPLLNTDTQDKILSEIIEPTLQGLKQNNCPYVGFLYAGLMCLPNGDIKVLEFNCRLGDPETQTLMMRVGPEWASTCHAAAREQLQHAPALQWSDPAITIVMASQGYPKTPRTGDLITGLTQPLPPSLKLFHSGTVYHNHQWKTAAGRVLSVTAQHTHLHSARELAHQHIKQIQWEHQHYRTDLAREHPDMPQKK